MNEAIRLGELEINVKRKVVKNVHLSVHPPDGRVTLIAPESTRLEVARAYAITRLAWIRSKQQQLKEQSRETRREFVERESHYVWGRRYLLSVVEKDCKPGIRLDHRRIVLTVRPGSSHCKRQAVIHEWHKALLHAVIPDMINRWEPRLNVHVTRYHLQRMKTRWGGCNHRRGSIRLNTELVKKPKDLLEYVVVHEMVHLIHPTHNSEFRNLISQTYPSWEVARAELNELPLGVVDWST